MGVNIWLIAGLLFIGYILQFCFGIMQIKNFTKAYDPLKKQGRVAIGKVSGSFRAGAIVMFAIDSNGIILDGTKMVGVTIFAKFKKLKGFENRYIGELKDEDVKHLNKPLRRAILNATSNYNIVMNGGEIPPALSPLQKFNKLFEKKKVA